METEKSKEKKILKEERKCQPACLVNFDDKEPRD